MAEPATRRRPDGETSVPDFERPIRVLLADRESGARRAIAALLDDIDGTILVGQVGSRDEIPAALRRLRVDVLVIDDRLLPHEGHPLATAGPVDADLRMIVIGMDEHPRFAARARELGAEAWIAKHTADETLREIFAR